VFSFFFPGTFCISLLQESKLGLAISSYGQGAPGTIVKNIVVRSLFDHVFHLFLPILLSYLKSI